MPHLAAPTWANWNNSNYAGGMMTYVTNNKVHKGRI